MVKREYDIFKYQNNSISLMISFFDSYYQTLENVVQRTQRCRSWFFLCT